MQVEAGYDEDTDEIVFSRRKVLTPPSPYSLDELANLYRELDMWKDAKFRLKPKTTPTDPSDPDPAEINDDPNPTDQ
jgi:hypothetical protein